MPGRNCIAFQKGMPSAMSQMCSCMPQISEQGSHGLAFKHSADHKLIVVDPSYTLDNDQVQRTEVLDAGYLQVVIFDHPTQHKHTVQDMAVPRHA